MELSVSNIAWNKSKNRKNLLPNAGFIASG